MATNERGGSLFFLMFALSFYFYILLSVFPHWLFKTEISYRFPKIHILAPKSSAIFGKC